MSTATVAPAPDVATASVYPARAAVDRAPVTPLRITARGIQIALGVVWVLDGLLQLQPSMFGQTFVTGTLEPAASSQPALLASSIDHVAHLVSVYPAAFDVVFATVQVLIGIGLLRPATVKPALGLSLAWAAGVWAFGEGFGMLLTPSASPLTGAPGAVLLYALLAVVVWPRRHMAAAGNESAAAEGMLGERRAHQLWALLWCGMGVLWLLPQNRGSGSISSQIASAPSGATAVVAHLQQTVAHALGGFGTGAAVCLALASFAIGLGPLVAPRRITIYLVLGAALAFDYWVLGQSMGGLLSGAATDPNIGPLFVLFALTLLPNAELDSRLGAPSHSSAPHLMSGAAWTASEALGRGPLSNVVD